MDVADLAGLGLRLHREIHLRRRARRGRSGSRPDLGVVKTFIEALAPRVTCPTHAVVVAAVPWARHRSSFTRAFEDHVAWLVVRTDKTTVSSLLRVSWRAVGSIIERVSSERGKLVDRCQWVLSLPFELRVPLAYRHELTLAVHVVTARVIERCISRDHFVVV